MDFSNWSGSTLERSVGALRLYRDGRHALEPSVQPGIGFRGSGGKLLVAYIDRFGRSGLRTSLRRLPAIMTPLWYWLVVSESEEDEEVLSSKMGSGSGMEGKLYISARTRMLGDIWESEESVSEPLTKTDVGPSNEL